MNISKRIVNDLESSIILYDTKITRFAGQIEKEKTLLINKNESVNAMHEVKNNAYKIKELLLKGEILKVSQILDKSWAAKKRVSNLVTNEKIDNSTFGAVKNITTNLFKKWGTKEWFGHQVEK